MNADLKIEIERLQRILQRAQVSNSLPSGATNEEIDFLEQTTGVELDENLREFYRFVNGSNNNILFAAFSDEPTPCVFESCRSLAEWHQQIHVTPTPFDPTEEERDFDWKPDARIQSFWTHPKWLPFAEFNGHSTSVMFDTNPTEQGTHGQIIVYQHDPDAIYFVANSFLEFLKLSNDLLEQQNLEFFD